MNFQSYLITDPKYYGDDIEKFSFVLNNSLQNNDLDMVCFRDKISSNTTELAKIFVDISKQYNIKQIIINSNIDLAQTLRATGVHLTSKQFDKIKDAKNKNLYTIISCHTIEDIKQAQINNADAITYSPIFSTPNKGEPKGLNELENVVKSYDIPIIALGGIINKDDIEKIKKTNCYGFASIRYFISNNLV
jgi:thiamine-phosphate pyrophosphorylase